MSVNSDFSDLLSELNAAEVRYLIVGAHAVFFYAEPRFTKDLDVWVDPTPENAARVLHALKAFGAPVGELRQEDLASPGITFQIGLPPNRIDVLTQVDGVGFEAAWPNRTEGRYGEQRMWIIGVDELRQNKRTVGRPQDLLDLAALERAEKVRGRGV